ncbi:hypothetical protein [Deinococcus yavapaiensis]|uniref:Uncharacterized protein n=1 Tax=Deinococcus yavapaiensis KR-236 TaxID=694435 RepID=A0A318S3F6_9DEIO|nr:hypothetical protein [Deinococcus yavapaiensis]PYE51965.1 hypothetical protein DES52_11311 [Deinococcus yavapaiensis KR-236]
MKRFAVVLIALSGVHAGAAGLLGTTTPLESTALCRDVLVCTRDATGTLSGDVTFVSYRIEGRQSANAARDAFYPPNLFSFQVAGRHRLIGYYSFVAGDLPAPITKFALDALARAVLGQALPANVASAFRFPLDTDGTAQTGFVREFRQDRAATFTLPGGALLSNVTARAFPTPPRGGEYEPYYVTYVADARYAPTLRAFINRNRPMEKIAAAERFLRDQGLRAKEYTRCSPGSTIHPNAETAPWQRWEQYFKARGYTIRGCCGGPPTYRLPGLALNGITIDFFGRDTSDVCMS